MWWDTIGRLMNDAMRRYPDPDVKMKKRKFELRCYEIQTYEDIVQELMNKPHTDPSDILYDYLIKYSLKKAALKHRPRRVEEYTVRINVVIFMNNKLNNY